MAPFNRRLSRMAIFLPLAAVLTVGFVALTRGSDVQSSAVANSVQKGLPDSAYHNTWAAYPDPPLPSSGPPDICGPWSAANSPEVQAIRATRGTLDSCLRVDHYWLVTTQAATGPAQIGILDCSMTDSACMDGWQAKDLTTFAWYPAPPSVTELKVTLVSGDLLTIVTNYGQWTFDISTATFARMTA